MALREFADARGNSWRVWETRPASGRLRDEFLHGWLTFERHERAAGDAAIRRRLAPVPDGWADLPDDDLRRLCQAAQAERPRRRLIE